MTGSAEKQRTADKFRWLDQVGADPNLTPLCFRVAYAIASRINRATGDAWPGQDRLAAECHTTDRSVRDVLTQLQAGGHLEITGKGGRGKGGQGKTSRYRPIMKAASTRKDTSTLKPEVGFHVSDPQPGRNRPSTRKKSTDQRGSQLPTIPISRETIDETIERKSLTITNHSSEFEAWWCEYPKKVDRLKAERLYTGIIKAKRATADELLAGARRYAAEKAGTEGKYIKHPTTWLNAGAWLDEPQPASTFVKPTTRADSAIAGMRRFLNGDPS